MKETCSVETVYGNIVDIVSRRIYPGKIAIEDGKIAEIEEVSAAECKNEGFILPGFVDSHIHIESTLMTPRNYARMAVENGVVAAVCDPHEIANVLGVEGIEYMESKVGIGGLAGLGIEQTTVAGGSHSGIVEVENVNRFLL